MNNFNYLGEMSKMNPLHNNEQPIAIESFTPNLNELFKQRFSNLLVKLDHTLYYKRAAIIQEELSYIYDNYDNDLDALKYCATLSVLIDLSQQGWLLDIQETGLTLKMENDNLDDKAKIRYRLSAERNAQFKQESVKAFIRTMETEKTYNNHDISVKVLIGDKNFLIDAINNNRRICDPYIQQVSNQRDIFTGYKLSDIWRYFRYTWSIPYKTMPGRNLFYLVRDRLQPFHPVIGIFALGNSVLNLTVRDDDIGWTVDAIKRNMNIQTNTTSCENTVSGTLGKKVSVSIKSKQETDSAFMVRREQYANKIYPLLLSNIDRAISEIYVKDLGYRRQTKHPKQEQIDSLLQLSEKYSKLSLNNRNQKENPNWEQEATSNLFTRKRAAELAKLLSTKMVFNSAVGNSNAEKLQYLLSNETGRKAINSALIANRKTKIGSNMMDIIVCGSIPPYNELLGGKIVSILACSPRVIKDYTDKYSKQVSEIASRMKGSRVIRDSSLVYLGTTSLYAVGSSQYNRIKVPIENEFTLEYRKMGITEGYGTVYFSKETTNLFSQILEIQDGGKRIGHVFGEGTSPRFRMISRGLSSLGIRAEAFLKHYSPRIVYSINLAKNTDNFLMGLENTADYSFDINDNVDVNNKTQDLIDFWYNRWLCMRLESVDIVSRLNKFKKSDIMLGSI